MAQALIPAQVMVEEVERPTSSRSRSRALLSVASHHLVLILVGAAFVLPLYWMVTTSLKSNSQLYSIPPTWVPHPLQWHFYPDAVNYIPFFTFLKTLSK